MKKIDLGQTIQIVANVGLIARIVYLAIEISQNTEMLAAQGRANLVDRRAGFTELMIPIQWMEENVGNR